MEKKRGRGRPPKPPDETKAGLLHIRVADDERESYQQAAAKCGLSFSEWVRERLNKAAVRDLKRP
jgi:predicted HicB family RNase H-like nuclease